MLRANCLAEQAPSLPVTKGHLEGASKFKRRLLRWGIVVAALLLAPAAIFLLSPSDPVSQENADRVREGMTREEVGRILSGNVRVAQLCVPCVCPSCWRTPEMVLEYSSDQAVIEI